MQEVKGNIAERVASAFNDRDPRMKRWACMSAERRRQYVLRWERRLQAIRDAGFEVVEAAEVERLTRERDEARSKETDYGEGFGEGWAAAQKGAAAEVERLRAERDTLLLDARDFLRWFNRNYPVYIVRPSGHPDHPWCALNNRLNAHADTLSALDSGLGAEP